MKLSKSIWSKSSTEQVITSGGGGQISNGHGSGISKEETVGEGISFSEAGGLCGPK